MVSRNVVDVKLQGTLTSVAVSRVLGESLTDCTHHKVLPFWANSLGLTVNFLIRK